MTGDLYNLHSIKSQVEDGEYYVDPPAVADALIAFYLSPPHRRRGSQKECSNPDNGPSASRNTTPGGPSTTDPIQLKPLLDT